MTKLKHKDNLGDRMKEYEYAQKYKLTRRVPIVVRIDGKAFHTYTKSLDRPFDEDLVEVMRLTTDELCRNIQNCVFGYTQSDEISLLLLDTRSLDTDPYFDNEVQKLASVISSMVTVYFNRNMLDIMHMKYAGVDREKYDKLAKLGYAMFDCRVMSVPYHDVPNYFVWRQQDCYKNSISMIAQSMFSHKELLGKKTDDKIQMIGPELMEKYKSYIYGFTQFRILNESNNRQSWDSILDKFDYSTVQDKLITLGYKY